MCGLVVSLVWYCICIGRVNVCHSAKLTIYSVLSLQFCCWQFYLNPGNIANISLYYKYESSFV
ncbi:hypothetical protein M758_6G195400 [Ceratodon purpureus]|nr:hypothetical protein M758_6G195400 [Ceratodon purpureus]